MLSEPVGHKLLNPQGLSRRPGNLRAPGRGRNASLLPDGLTAEDVQRHLEKLLTSETFQRAKRLSRFLRFIVEQDLAGDQNTLKEYSIGLQVFDRPESFDTRLDPIVRVEAARLRAKIRDYYGGEGCDDLVWLGLGKRGYRPLFQRRKAQSADSIARLESPTAESVPPAESSSPRAIAVLPFKDLSPLGNQEYFCDGITQDIVSALAKIKGLSVVARTSAAQFKGKAKDIREIARYLQVGRVLEGSVQKIGPRVRISAHLVDAATGFDCWAETYEPPLDDVLTIQEEVAREITVALRSEAVWSKYSNVERA
jgi:adenylate cyclase